MQTQLRKWMADQTPVEIIYLDRTGTFTRRKIIVYTIAANSIRAYCFTRKSIRTFQIDCILSAAPAKRKNPYLISS
ncbi:hypothetical protein [Jeotgalibacillus sp. R-1-5s-1]|uniref:WYL domain-containing protein n=1 Tax=Jeotgalibacillus sp. R-1-5s-1 TaxID=2555897 RepID=UPI001FC82C44|nr:hypothetical protein [Jeotgalibacillus sp. R-1-5s-1]